MSNVSSLDMKIVRKTTQAPRHPYIVYSFPTVHATIPEQIVGAPVCSGWSHVGGDYMQIYCIALDASGIVAYTDSLKVGGGGLERVCSS